MIKNIIRKVGYIISKIKIVWPNIIYAKSKNEGRKLYRILIPYYRFRTWYPFWFFVLNKKSRLLYQANNGNQKLTLLQENIINDFKKYGIAFADLDSLFPNEPVLKRLQEYSYTLYGNARRRTKAKSYLVDLWDKRPMLDSRNPFLSLILDPAILNIVNAYMGMWSKFFFLTLAIATPMPRGSQPVSSQTWHRDPEDRKMCKVFIYLNDVDENSGPFIYVKGSHHSGRLGKLFPQKPPRGCSPPLGALENAVSKEDIITAVGKAGTVIFCDTSGLHRGGYATSKERLMFTGGFFSSAALWPQKYDYPKDFQPLKNLSPMAKYALKK